MQPIENSSWWTVHPSDWCNERWIDKNHPQTRFISHAANLSAYSHDAQDQEIGQILFDRRSFILSETHCVGNEPKFFPCSCECRRNRLFTHDYFVSQFISEPKLKMVKRNNPIPLLRSPPRLRKLTVTSFWLFCEPRHYQEILDELAIISRHFQSRRSD